MREQLEKRIEELKEEFGKGQKMLADIEKQKEDLTSSLLRISGAIQVIEEALKQDAEPEIPETPIPVGTVNQVL